MFVQFYSQFPPRFYLEHDKISTDKYKICFLLRSFTYILKHVSPLFTSFLFCSKMMPYYTVDATLYSKNYTLSRKMRRSVRRGPNRKWTHTLRSGKIMFSLFTAFSPTLTYLGCFYNVSSLESIS